MLRSVRPGVRGSSMSAEPLLAPPAHEGSAVSSGKSSATSICRESPLKRKTIKHSTRYLPRPVSTGFTQLLGAAAQRHISILVIADSATLSLHKMGRAVHAPDRCTWLSLLCRLTASGIACAAFRRDAPPDPTIGGCVLEPAWSASLAGLSIRDPAAAPEKAPGSWGAGLNLRVHLDPGRASGSC